jgi:hypothetical protein
MDFEDCMKWRKERDYESLENVVNSERERLMERTRASLSNDVWRYRSQPPSDWKKPLPDFMEERRRMSSLFAFQEQKDREEQRNQELRKKAAAQLDSSLAS